MRNIAQVSTAVARGDLSQKITVDAQGEILELKNTVNTMVDQLSSFADEVTRVAREVGTEGKLGGQAQVKGVSGTWRDLTDNVNSMASNLTAQVRNIASVTTAVARGDLSQKITVDAQGEILELKNTVNTMVDQLSSFADEVTRVAREVGIEGKLGGQAQVKGVSGTWRDLTENVNQLASTLTTQLRAIAQVSTAVTRGDLTQRITVEAQGEVAELKDNINQMIVTLRETTKKNAEQGWLDSNLARIGGLLQGQRDLGEVCRMIMTEVTPLVDAQLGAFFLADTRRGGDAAAADRRRTATWPATTTSPSGRARGWSGRPPLSRRTIRVGAPRDGSLDAALRAGRHAPGRPGRAAGPLRGRAARRDRVRQRRRLLRPAPVVPGAAGRHHRHRGQHHPGQPAYRGAARPVPAAGPRAAGTVRRAAAHQRRAGGEGDSCCPSRRATSRLKNREIELARIGLEEKAQQLARASAYKSEFLANMSHELRTPLNSLLLLARLLADNSEQNLTDEADRVRPDHPQRRLRPARADRRHPRPVEDRGGPDGRRADARSASPSIRGYVEQAFAPQAEEKGLDFQVRVSKDLPPTLITDAQRLQQILRNLLSNAVKFTDNGAVTLRIAPAPESAVFDVPALATARQVVAFTVIDTGIGISDDKLSLIFEAFQQADGTTSRRYGGTGLGLSISRDLARLIGGTITVSSAPGSGLDVHPVHPGRAGAGRGGAPPTSTSPRRAGPTAVAADAAGSAPSPERRTVSPATRQLDGATVLIIDDDVRNVFALTSALELHGMTVLYSDNGGGRGPAAGRASGGGHRADGRDDARPGRVRDDPRDPPQPPLRRPAGGVPDRQGDAR